MAMVIRVPKLIVTSVAPTLVGALASKPLSNATGKSASQAFPAGTATNDLVIAAVLWRKTAQTISASGTGWTLLDTQVTGSTTRLSVFWKKKLSTETQMTFTVPTSASGTSVIIDSWTWRGYNATTPIGTFTVYNNTSSDSIIPIPGGSVNPKAGISYYGAYAPSAGSRTVSWPGDAIKYYDTVSGTIGSYIGSSSASLIEPGAGFVDDELAVISITQPARLGYMIPVNPA